MLRVDQIMTRNVRTCRRGDSLSAAARIMWEGDCGCVPVTEREDGGARVVGMITDRDICMAGYLQGRPLSAIRIESAMARDVHSCRPTDSVAEALSMLRQHQLHRLPVVDNGGHLVGMLSLADAAREAVREHGRKGRDVTDARIAEVLEAICESRGPHDMSVVAR
jgi:CBS-domain-containing membrane protein